MPIAPGSRGERAEAAYGSGTAPVRPQEVPVEIGCADGDVPVIWTSTPPGHETPLMVTVGATR